MCDKCLFDIFDDSFLEPFEVKKAAEAGSVALYFAFTVIGNGKVAVFQRFQAFVGHFNQLKHHILH